jgi:hypothetical protein
MTSYSTSANQPYSVHLHRNGQVEVIYGQPTKVSHASAPRHTSPHVSSSSPRSTAATFGSSNTRIASSTTRRESPATSSSTKHRVPESSTHHHRSSDPHRSSSSHPGHHSSPQPSGERHRHNSTSRLDKPSLPIPIPVRSHSHSRSRSLSHTPSPQGSPKQTRFSPLATVVHIPIVTSSGHLAPPLSHSYQAQAPISAAPHRSPKLSTSSLAVPVSRHKPSSSADSFFFLNRPKGWYNRRGDRFLQKGVIERQPKHLEWHPTFGGYPEPGTGWMDENGRFMPIGGGILKN